MSSLRWWLILWGLNSVSVLNGETFRVTSPETLTAAVRRAEPGDEVVIRNGIWRDVHVRVVGTGSAKDPIRIRPETPGGVLITGTSRFRLGGSHLVVSGLHLKNFQGVSDWFQFREDSKNLARHCRVTDCVFEEERDFDPGEMESRWVGIYGQDNELDHCRVEGKKSRGASVVVWLQEGIEARHHLHHNHFGFRPPLGRNGGETLRVGDSQTHQVVAKCLIEHNLFERCNGEAECISNKSCENVYRRNRFLEVEGTLSLRHGHRCRVEENLFQGNDLKHTGGIRVIGEDHLVRGNYLIGLGGTKARGALVLQNGIANSPANGYSPVVGARLVDNCVLRCRESLVLGYADKDSTSSVVAPKDCVFERNFFLADGDRMVITVHHLVQGSRWISNVATGKLLGLDPPPESGLQFSAGSPSSGQIPPIPDWGDSDGVGPGWKR